MRYATFLVGAAALLSGCVTHIQPEDQTQTAPTTPLSGFTSVYIAPMARGAQPGFSQAAVDKVAAYLNACLSSAFKNAQQVPADIPDKSHALLITPAILEAKKVSVAKRIFLGPLPGSSAALMEVTYTNLANSQVVAQPVFYAKAEALSGTFTIGIEDNLMLNRLADDACAYSRKYMGSAGVAAAN